MFVYQHMDIMDCYNNFRLNEHKLSKKQRRVVQKQLKLENTLARHENIICLDSATRVCPSIDRASAVGFFNTGNCSGGQEFGYIQE